MQNKKNGTVTSQELATLTDTNERFVRDWLALQVTRALTSPMILILPNSRYQKNTLLF